MANSCQIQYLRGSYGSLTGLCDAFWKVLPCKISPIYCRVSYVAVTRIPLLVLCNTWHYVIIRRRKIRFPKFVLRCSYDAALRKGVTMALNTTIIPLPLKCIDGCLDEFTQAFSKSIVSQCFQLKKKKSDIHAPASHSL